MTVRAKLPNGKWRPNGVLDAMMGDAQEATKIIAMGDSSNVRPARNRGSGWTSFGCQFEIKDLGTVIRMNVDELGV